MPNRAARVVNHLARLNKLFFLCRINYPFHHSNSQIGLASVCRNMPVRGIRQLMLNQLEVTRNEIGLPSNCARSTNTFLSICVAALGATTRIGYLLFLLSPWILEICVIKTLKWLCAREILVRSLGLYTRVHYAGKFSLCNKRSVRFYHRHN